MSKKPKSIVLTGSLDIVFMQWVATLPRESLPDLTRVLQAIAERWPAEKAHAAALKLLRVPAIRTPSRRAAELVRIGLRVVGA